MRMGIGEFVPGPAVPPYHRAEFLDVLVPLRSRVEVNSRHRDRRLGPRWRRGCRGSTGLVLAGLLFGMIAVASARPLEVSGRAMGTTWSVKWVPANTAVDATALERDVAGRLEELEQIFSTYRPRSVISRFNANESTEWIQVPPELATVVEASCHVSARTDGAYDVTVLPLLELWGFAGAPAPDRAPGPAALARARELVGWRKLDVTLDPPALRKREGGVRIDVSSMAKGFAVDAISGRLQRVGVSNHLVAVGGDLRARGDGPEGDGWRVAIEAPAPAGDPIAEVLHLRDAALSTSGNHRNRVRVGRGDAGHILDPRTGVPAAGSLASVSVVAATCAISSALATGLFVLGAEEGWALARQEHISALFLIRSNGELRKQPTAEFSRPPAR